MELTLCDLPGIASIGLAIAAVLVALLALLKPRLLALLRKRL